MFSRSEWERYKRSKASLKRIIISRLYEQRSQKIEKKKDLESDLVFLETERIRTFAEDVDQQFSLFLSSSEVQALAHDIEEIQYKILAEEQELDDLSLQTYEQALLECRVSAEVMYGRG